MSGAIYLTADNGRRIKLVGPSSPEVSTFLQEQFGYRIVSQNEWQAAKRSQAKPEKASVRLAG